MKKIIIIASIIIALVLAVGIAAPVFAADPGGTIPSPVQGTGKCGRAVILARLLLVQDEVKVLTILDKAVGSGRISYEQAEKIHSFWTLNHEKAVKKVILGGLNRIQDETKLGEMVNKALDNGRITQEQAEKIVAAWHKIHEK